MCISMHISHIAPPSYQDLSPESHALPKLATAACLRARPHRLPPALATFTDARHCARLSQLLGAVCVHRRCLPQPRANFTTFITELVFVLGLCASHVTQCASSVVAATKRTRASCGAASSDCSRETRFRRHRVTGMALCAHHPPTLKHALLRVDLHACLVSSYLQGSSSFSSFSFSVRRRRRRHFHCFRPQWRCPCRRCRHMVSHATASRSRS